MLVHRNSLIPPLFIEVPVPRQEGVRSCICVLRVSILPLSAILIRILELFQQCGSFWNCSNSVVVCGTVPTVW